MADDLGVQFFTGAKTQFETATKWRWVIVALLAYLQVGLVGPFAAHTRDKAVVDRQLADNRAAEEALKPVLDAANKLADSVSHAKDQVASALKTDLIERFQRLSAVINGLAELGAAKAEGDDGAALFASPSRMPQMQQQAPREDPSALVPMSAALRRLIGESAKFPGGDLPAELQAYVNAQVIAPAFTRANQAWAGSGVTIAQDGAAALAAGIARARTSAPAAAQDLDRLDKSVAALREQAQRLVFAPPESPDWWRTVGGKEASILSMTFGFAARVRDLTTSQVALQALSTQITDIVGRNREAAAALTDSLAELDKRAAELQSQLGEIGAPLKVISFRLAEIAPFMPLILAVALAAIAAWTADGLRRMTLAAGLVGDAATRTIIRTWLRAAAGGSRAQVAAMELAVMVAGVAWVLAAARTVAPLGPPLLSRPVLVAIVVAARAWHWRRANAAVSADAI